MLEVSGNKSYRLNSKAWVVFVDETEVWWLRGLRRGFRHCYILLNDGQHWLSIDPLSHMIEFTIHHHIEQDFDLPAWHRGRGHNVVKAELRDAPQVCAPLMAFTCVEMVKRILGIHDFWIWTPYDLYRYLTKSQGGTGWKEQLVPS